MPTTTYRWPTKKGGYEIFYPEEPRLFTVDAVAHVRGSLVGIADHCAAARALRAQDDVDWAWVKAYRTALQLEDGRIAVYLNPLRLTNGVRDFDAQAGLFPAGTYVLRPLGRSDRSGERVNRKSISGRAGSGKREYRKRPTYQFR